MSRGNDRSGYGLTPRQRDLLVYLSARESCPSYAEMALAIGAESKSTINRLVCQLEKRGYIRRLPKCARAIELIHRDGAGEPPAKRPMGWQFSEVLYLPLHGRID